jgi:hypothetical protein
MIRLAMLFGLALVALPAAAQKDFLTEDETDQLREAQAPDLRLQLYLRFARTRLDLIEQLFAKPATGRSGVLHDTLEQFAAIIEAIDTNIDDALERKRPLTTLATVAKTEREMLKRLEKYAETTAPDRERFQFALDQAIETLRDSAELSDQDVQLRAKELSEREAEARKQRDQMSTPDRKSEQAKQREREEAERQGTTPGKKKPTLYRKDEKKEEKPPESKP